MSANTVTSWPAATRLTDKSLAKSGKSGAIMKPSVPMANVPNASQYSRAIGRDAAGVMEFSGFKMVSHL